MPVPQQGCDGVFHQEIGDTKTGDQLTLGPLVKRSCSLSRPSFSFTSLWM
jgi:hypothetical protein